jgi:hypothetical protein
MSTRSNIAIELPNKKVKAIYCHSDGYPYGVGTTLMDYYNSYEKALELFNYGDASYIDESIDKCSFYHRDWNRKLDKARTYRDEWIYMRGLSGDAFIEYVYIFKNNEWYISELKTADTENGYENFIGYHTKFSLLANNEEYIKYRDKHEKHAEVKMIGQLGKMLSDNFGSDKISVQSFSEGFPKKN